MEIKCVAGKWFIFIGDAIAISAFDERDAHRLVGELFGRQFLTEQGTEEFLRIWADEQKLYRREEPHAD